MRWLGRRESSNIEDRRAQGFGGFSGLGGRRRLALPLHSKSGMAIFAVMIIIMLLAGADWRMLLAEFTGIQVATPAQSYSGGSTGDDEARRFVAVVLADTEDAWSVLFKEQGRSYAAPTLVLFRGAVQSGCGFAQAALGPFYCPTDAKIYIDLGFFDELRHTLGAPGDFAQAYVLAHEVGHHVQHLLGGDETLARLERGAKPSRRNRLQVLFELQADCYAGLWAHQTEKLAGALEPGDIDEALGAAAAIGDDILQKRAQGFVVPDSFTHGSSAERASWFRRGYESGALGACDSFAE